MSYLCPIYVLMSIAPRILKDASAMDYLDRLYVTTEKQIQERRESHSSRYR